MTDVIKRISKYVLNPDHRGEHLRKMAEQMAQADMDSEKANRLQPQVANQYLERSALAIGRFIHSTWGPAGPEEFAPGMLTMLLKLQDRMRGMERRWAWNYAVNMLNNDIRQRPPQASSIQRIDADSPAA